MTATSLHVRFPGETFISRTEFDNFCRDSQPLLDARYAYEQRLGETAEGRRRQGSCAPCLRPACFASDAGDTPDWRDGQICDCPDRLGNRARAMLHLLEARLGLDAWSRVLVLGPATPLDARLAGGRPPPIRLARLIRSAPPPGHDGWRLDAADGAFTHAIAWDYLHRVPPLRPALGELRRVLAIGGRFAFTLPFHYRSSHTVSRLDHLPRRTGSLPAEHCGPVHQIGWDILDMLHTAGFAQAVAHHHWSEELGYLGAFNLLFSAAT